jgi:predicted nucleic acid-binding Zn ribbon protein
MRAAKTRKLGLRVIVARVIESSTLAVGSDKTNPVFRFRFDKYTLSMHCGSAMTTAQTRVPASPIGLVGAFALMLIVVISILPH